MDGGWGTVDDMAKWGPGRCGGCVRDVRLYFRAFLDGVHWAELALRISRENLSGCGVEPAALEQARLCATLIVDETANWLAWNESDVSLSVTRPRLLMVLLMVDAAPNLMHPGAAVGKADLVGCWRTLSAAKADASSSWCRQP